MLLIVVSVLITMFLALCSSLRLDVKDFKLVILYNLGERCFD